jgi:AcrR family transcriptional regulator
MAIRLWQTQDFGVITVDAIVEAAGVSKGTFYYHFRRKEDLLVDLGWATVDRVGTEAEEDYRINGDLDRAIEIGIAGLVRRVIAMPPGAAARTIQEFGFRRTSAPDSTASGLRPANSGRHGFLSGLLQAAQNAGDIAPKVDSEEVAKVINQVLSKASSSSSREAEPPRRFHSCSPVAPTSFSTARQRPTPAEAPAKTRAQATASAQSAIQNHRHSQPRLWADSQG